ncbi:hypothetical protein AAFF_G00419150 [Aldrovandia affinis]|uniref:Fibronectin type-III domain-containing protein n=1 Tax=Aldrovandia affinis TaxID=143900 RepID=A0AAD7SAE3_9TELE|nr:hypothetical protein AAFF_G00419150 [Aldrovandia affinis]
MACLTVCLFLLSAFHQQAQGAAVACLWEEYFHIGQNVSGACQVGSALPGCGGLSLHLTADGKPVLAYHYTNDSAHFTVPAPAEGTLHLRCGVTCAGLKLNSYCDITLQGGYPPSPVSRPVCHILLNITEDVHCSWNPGYQPLLPTSFTLHWEQREQRVYGEQRVAGDNMIGIIHRGDFRHGAMSVWVTANNSLGAVQSETVSFDTIDIVKPHAPTITQHFVQPLEILWNLECDPSSFMTENLDRSCEVQYRIRGEQAWTEGDYDSQDSFLLLDPQPFSVYEFRVRCACLGKDAVRSTWSHIYSVQSAEGVPDGKLDIWSDCDDESDGQLECAIVWKSPSHSVAQGKVLGYVVTLEHNAGDPDVMNLSTEELGCGEGAEHMEGLFVHCFPHRITLQGIKGVYLTAYTSQGATDPAPLALPTTGPYSLSADVAVVKVGRGFNVSWVPPSHLTEDVQYVVQCKEAGLHSMQGFYWIKVNGTQKSIILTGDFKNYIPYNISLFSVITNRWCLLGSAIAYTVQGVPPKVTGFKVSQNSPSDVILTWEHIPLTQMRGVILRYHLGQDNHTEYNVSGSRNSLLISGLQPGQAYQVWICAESEAGQGPRQYHHFITTASPDYIICTVVPLMLILVFGVLLLSLCCSHSVVQYLKRLGGCWEKVPDPTNCRLIQQVQRNNDMPEFFFLPESIQWPSHLEVIKIQALKDDGCLDRTSLSDGQMEGKASEWQMHTEEEEKEKEAEEEQTEPLEKGVSDLNSVGEDYSKMIDTEGDEEDVSWNHSEEFFSGPNSGLSYWLSLPGRAQAAATGHLLQAKPRLQQPVSHHQASTAGHLPPGHSGRLTASTETHLSLINEAGPVLWAHVA